MPSPDKDFEAAAAKNHDLSVNYKVAFGTDAGKVVLDHLSKVMADDEVSSFDVDPYANAYNCGLRDALLHIRKMIRRADVDPSKRFQQQEGK